jgi:hypothetical protein
MEDYTMNTNPNFEDPNVGSEQYRARGCTKVAFTWKGQQMSGVIQSANFYGADGWYVEFTHDAQSSRKEGRFDYVKSVADGAHSFTFS